MNHVLTWAARRPWTVLILIAALSLLALWRLPALQVRISVTGMMERGTPAWEFLEQTKAAFGSDALLVIFLSDRELFTPSRLEAVGRAVQQLETLPRVKEVVSLFSVRNLKNQDGFISSRPYLETPPRDPAQARAVRDQALANPLLADSLVSRDGRAMAINLVYEEDPADPDFSRHLGEAVEAVLAPLRRQLEQAFQIGSPTIRASLSERILRDQRTLLPLSVAVLLVTLGLSLRRLSGVLIPLVTAGLSLLWTLGFMAAMQIPVNVMTSIVPALIVVVGSTEDIHLLSEYFGALRAGKRGMAAIDHMADRMGAAVLLTFVTTYLGFASITLNDVELLYQFGLVASTGLLFNFLITIALVPVFTRLFGERMARRAERESERDGGLPERLASRVLEWVLRRRRAVLAGVSAITLAALAGTAQLRVNNNPMDFLEPASPVHAQAREVHRRLSGIHTFSVVVDGAIRDTFKQVYYLEELKRIQDHIAATGHFDKSFSLADFVALLNHVMGDDPDPRALPEADDLLREYLLFIPHDSVRQYVTKDFSRARILVRHDIGDSQALNAAVRELQAFVAAHVDPALRVRVTGSSLLSNQAVDAMARGQLQSLFLLSGVILVLIAGLFIHLKAGIVALLPNLFPVVMLFGVMGYTGIPLDSGTGLVAAIALGICIDDTLHTMARFNRELKRRGDQLEALRHTLAREARPIITTSLALAAGFGVLALSSFAPVAHFGLLSAMVILTALFTTFVITPLLLDSAQLLTVLDMLSLHIQQGFLDNAPLFRGMNTWQIKKLLLASEIRSVAAGDYILREGGRGSEMYVVVEGQVAAQRTDARGEVREYRVMDPGALFGEVGPLTGKCRTADVVSRRDSRVLVLSWAHMERLSRLFPFISVKLFRNFTHILSLRLSETSEYRAERDGPAAG